jgi:hypothetical protein
MVSLEEVKKTNYRIHMKFQMALNSQNNVEKDLRWKTDTL